MNPKVANPRKNGFKQKYEHFYRESNCFNSNNEKDELCEMIKQEFHYSDYNT